MTVTRRRAGAARVSHVLHLHLPRPHAIGEEAQKKPPHPTPRLSLSHLHVPDILRGEGVELPGPAAPPRPEMVVVEACGFEV